MTFTGSACATCLDASAVDDVNQSADIDLYLKLNWKSERWVGKTDDEFQEDGTSGDMVLGVECATHPGADGKFSKDVWWDPGVEVTNGIELSKETPEEVRADSCIHSHTHVRLLLFCLDVHALHNAEYSLMRRSGGVLARVPRSRHPRLHSALPGIHRRSTRPP